MPVGTGPPVRQSPLSGDRPGGLRHALGVAGSRRGLFGDEQIDRDDTVVVEQPLLHGRIGQECSLLLDRRRSVVLLQAPSIRRAVLVP